MTVATFSDTTYVKQQARAWIYTPGLPECATWAQCRAATPEMQNIQHFSPDVCNRITGCNDGRKCGIGRAVMTFDTSTIPVGSSITAAKLTGAWLVSGSIGSLMGYADLLIVGGNILLVRANGIDVDSGAFQYLGNCGIVIGKIYVPDQGTGTFEVNFDGIGLASIVCGGTTYIGVRSEFDTPTCGLNQTARFSGMINQSTSPPILEVTYTTDIELLVETYAATDLTTVSATLNGAITQGAAIKRGFDYGVGGDNLINEWYESGTYGVGAFSHGITGLTPGQGLCHRAKASED